MRKTWAHNGIFVGILIGILVYAWTSSIILCLLAAVAVSVVCFKLIRALENALYKGADKVVGQLNARHDRLAAEKNAAQSAAQNSAQSMAQNAAQNGTQNPAAAPAGWPCAGCGSVNQAESKFCIYCGKPRA